jgi:hypothetical protein
MQSQQYYDGQVLCSMKSGQAAMRSMQKEVDIDDLQDLMDCAQE